MSFLIRPENQAFLDGQAPYPAKVFMWDMTNHMISTLIYNVIVIGCCLIMVGLMVNMFYRQHLLQDSIETIATVTNKRPPFRLSRNSLTYQFVVDGNTHQNFSGVSRTIYNSHEIGDSIMICYAVSNIDISDIAEQCDQQIQWVYLLFLIVFSAMFLLYPYTEFQNYKKFNLLKKHGQIINGELLEITHKYNHQYVIKARFLPPNIPESIEGTRTYHTEQFIMRYRNEQLFRANPIPPVGSPIAILYHDHDLWEVL